MTRPRLILLIRCAVLAGALWLGAEALLLFVPVALMMPPLFAATCTIFSDDFSTDRTGTDYTVVVSSWTVTGGKLTTGSSGALIVENTAGTTGHGRASIVGQVSTSTASFRLVGSYVDASNYVFCEVTINGASSTFKLWKRVSGSDTQLGSTYTFTGATATNYTLEICWNGTIASASIDSANSKSGLYSGSGNQAGVGASAAGGTVTLDTFTFDKNIADDGSCTACQVISCITCNGFSGIASRLQVDVNSLSDGTCGACDTLNGTYVVDYVGVSSCPFYSSACIYKGIASATCGSESVTWIHVYVENKSTGANLTVVFGDGDDVDYVNLVSTGTIPCGGSPPNVSITKSVGTATQWYFAECSFTGDGTVVPV